MGLGDQQQQGQRGYGAVHCVAGYGVQKSLQFGSERFYVLLGMITVHDHFKTSKLFRVEPRYIMSYHS